MIDDPRMIARLLGRPIAYHRVLAEVTKSVTAGVFLSQAIHWALQLDSPDEWFSKTRDEWRSETYLSRTEQESSRKKLRSLGILREEMRGLPATTHFSIDFKVLYELLEKSLKLAGNLPSSWQKTRQQVGCKPTNKVAENLPSPYIDNNIYTDIDSDIDSKTPLVDKNIYISITTLRAEFDEFWAVYPKRPGNPRTPAFESYQKARKKGATAEAILAGAKAYAQFRQGQDSQYTALAVTWLNQARWDADYTAAPVKPKRAGGGLC
jgi:hypothetical protein